MTDSATPSDRIEFGTNLKAALRRWGGFAEFPAGFDETNAVLDVLSSVLGEVASCYALDSGSYIGVRLAAMPTVNAAHVAWGYVWVTPAALATAEERGVDLRGSLKAAGVPVHDGFEAKGLTVWNSQHQEKGPPTHVTEVDKRLCPECFVLWRGHTCPDCEVELLPPRDA